MAGSRDFLADLTAFLNVQRFADLARWVVPVAFVLAGGLFAVGLYLGLWRAPEVIDQGHSARIMFVHVPSAWLASLIYVAIALWSGAWLIWRAPLSDLAAEHSAPLGAAVTAVCLVTGAIWGQPTWGTWWVWDARLTSVLILFLSYLALMALRAAMDDRLKAARACAILSLVGVVNVVIVRFSVDWWNTLHQPSSVLRDGGPAMPASFLTPLLIMGLGMLAFYIGMLCWAMRTAIRERAVLGRLQRRTG